MSSWLSVVSYRALLQAEYPGHPCTRECVPSAWLWLTPYVRAWEGRACLEFTQIVKWRRTFTSLKLLWDVAYLWDCSGCWLFKNSILVVYIHLHEEGGVLGGMCPLRHRLPSRKTQGTKGLTLSKAGALMTEAVAGEATERPALGLTLAYHCSSHHCYTTTPGPFWAAPARKEVRTGAAISREPWPTDLFLWDGWQYKHLLPPDDSISFWIKPRFLATASGVLHTVVPIDFPSITPCIASFLPALLASLPVLKQDRCDPASGLFASLAPSSVPFKHLLKCLIRDPLT